MNTNTTSVMATVLLMAIRLVNVGNEPPGTTPLEGAGTQVSRNERTAAQSSGATAETHGYTWSNRFVRAAAGAAPVGRSR